ncbi:MAG: thioredoxin family protein [Kiritimatiellaeota bacterium]|nr:thioredoxin family protein [Kiritimatiellota bacterium]
MSSLILFGALSAGAVTPIPTQRDVEPGEWCTDYNAARKYAEDNGIPILVVWGRRTCSYCKGFDNNALSQNAFIQWRQQKKIVLLYAKEEDGTTDASRILSWARSGRDSDTGQTIPSLTNIPIVLLYWKKGGTVKVEKRFVGRKGDLPVGGATILDQLMGTLEKYIGDYSPDPFPAVDAWDPADDTRAGATPLTLSQEAFAHGPHYLNGTDTNDWFCLKGLPAGSTNLVWISGLVAEEVADLNARFYVGDASTPSDTKTLTSLAATPYKCIVPQGSGAPQDVYVQVSRRPGTAASVKYTFHARKYIPRAIGFATATLTATEPAKGKTATLAIPVMRSGDDAAAALSVNVQYVAVSAASSVTYDYSKAPSKLSWTASGADTQTINITLQGDGLWTGDQTFTVTLASPTAGFALAPHDTVTVTVRESNAYSAAKLSVAAVETPALGKKTAFTTKLKPAVHEGDTVTVWLACAGGNAMRVSADMKGSSPDWLMPPTLTWLDGDRKEKAITFTVPEQDGFHLPQTVTLSIASASGAALVSGKAALPFTVYNKVFAAPLTAFASSNPKLPLRTVNDDWFVTDGGVLRSVPLSGGGAAVMTATIAGPGILRFAAGGDAALAFTIGGKPLTVSGDGLVQEYLIPSGRHAAAWTATGADYATLSAMTFSPLPAETLGSFNGWAVVTNGAETAQGLATMTVSASGKISGKLTLPGKTLSFSSPGYDTLADGTLMVAAGLSATYKKEAFPLALSVTTNAPGVVAIASADGTIAARLNRNGWSDKVLSPERDAALRLALNYPAAALSKAPSGYYTLVIPATAETVAAGLAGTGYLTLTIDKKGKTKAAGKLADGTSVSMSGVVLLDEDNKPYMRIFVSPKAYSGGVFLAPLAVHFSGCARLSGDALWESRNPKATAVLDEGFRFALPVQGGWYAKTATLRTMYAGEGFSAEIPDGHVYFAFNAKGTALLAATCDEENPACLKVAVKSTTGLFSGSYREPPADGAKKGVTRKLFGVLTPALTQDGADFAAAGFIPLPQVSPHKHTQSEAVLLRVE